MQYNDVRGQFVFRRALVFLFALLSILYLLVILNGYVAGGPLLGDYWVPRRSQLPGLAAPDSMANLTLNETELEHLATVEKLAEQLEKEIEPIVQPIGVLQTPRVEEPKVEEQAETLPVSSGTSTELIPALEKTSKQQGVKPVQTLEFGKEGYEQLEPFYEQLHNVLTSGKEVRILHFGDSQIEGDRISSYLRTRLQKEFGGAGVGFVSVVPPTYPPYGLSLSPSRDWKFYSMMPANRRKSTLSYGIIGGVSQFTTYGDLTDTSKVSAEVKVKRELKAGRGMQFTRCHVLFSAPNADCRIGLFVNDSVNESHTFAASEKLQSAILPVPAEAAKFVVQFTASQTPNIYGISYETGYGIQVDNVPLRGSGGTDFGAITDTMFMQVNELLAPKLVLLQFGVNVVPSELSSYTHYGKQLQEQILRLKRLLPETAFILIGVSDMGRKEEETFHSYSNIGLVRKAQRKAAMEAGIAFWDSYAAMGGANSIIRWVNANPPLATNDYVHFTPRGARYLAELFCTALLDVYYNPDVYKRTLSEE